ncbi:MAG: hypothetical protein AAGA68_07095 [Pseudomonadota bacterium]
MKVNGADGSVLMEVKSLDREGGKITFTGTVMGAMPVKGVLSPEDVRSAYALIKRKKNLWFFLATFIFRRSPKAS